MYITGPGVYGLDLAALRWEVLRIHSFDHSISLTVLISLGIIFRCLGFRVRSLQETSRSAVLACAMASFAAVMCATLLSEPLAASSAWRNHQYTSRRHTKDPDIKDSQAGTATPPQYQQASSSKKGKPSWSPPEPGAVQVSLYP